MEPDDFMKRGYLLPEGCKDLTDVCMYQVVDSHSVFLEKLGPGLCVTIDAKQTPTFLVKPGTSVRVHRPDGTVINRVVGGVEVFRPKVGLFFPNTEQHEIPDSSQIELPA